MSPLDSGSLARLEMDGGDLVNAVKPIVRASAKSAAGEVVLSFEAKMLTIEAAGLDTSVSATGIWNGACTTNKNALRLFATVPRQTIIISVTGDDRLHIGATSLPARWRPGPKPQIDLPLEPDLRALLRLRIEHSDEDLLGAGLLERVERAERDRDRLVKNAAHWLKQLGDFEAEIATLVARRILAGPKPVSANAGLTREQARLIAERVVAERSLGVGVRDVYLASEITWRRPTLYAGPNLDDCWIAYVDKWSPPGLHSSLIVLISKRTGEVLYAGSANDEG